MGRGRRVCVSQGCGWGDQGCPVPKLRPGVLHWGGWGLQLRGLAGAAASGGAEGVRGFVSNCTRVSPRARRRVRVCWVSAPFSPRGGKARRFVIAKNLGSPPAFPRSPPSPKLLHQEMLPKKTYPKQHFIFRSSQAGETRTRAAGPAEIEAAPSR